MCVRVHGLPQSKEMNVSNDSIATVNATTIDAREYASPPPPPMVTQQHTNQQPATEFHGEFTMAENTAIALLASSAVGSILGLIAVTAVLVCVTKQLARLVAALRGETAGSGTSVHTALLAGSNLPPVSDAFAGPGNATIPTPTTTPPSDGSGSSGSKSGNGKSILKRPTPRLAAVTGSSSGLTRHEKARRARPDNGGTSCAIPEEEDEDEDQNL